MTPKCGGTASLIIGGGNTRNVNSILTRYLPDGRLLHSFAAGIERTLVKTKYADLFTSGQAGFAIVGESKSGLAQGTVGLLIPVYRREAFTLSVVPIGSGSNIPAKDGSWTGGGSVTVQFDFGK